MSSVTPAGPPDSQRGSTSWSRRAVLTGAAGAVIGAGATEITDRLTRHHPAPESHLASPGEELMTEHGILKRVLLVYRAAADQLAAGQTPPEGAIPDAAQIISDYVESLHEGLEEAYVFPRVQHQEPDLIRTLLIQHDRGRHLTAAIITTAGGDLRSAGARNDLLTYLDRFVRMYEPHEAWEDTVVYPALRAVTPQRTLDLLAERFADEANRQIGDPALTVILDRVTGVEQQLGVGNLNTFTPPVLS
jgi:hemerythrin-like domain-containing protein